MPGCRAACAGASRLLRSQRPGVGVLLQAPGRGPQRPAQPAAVPRARASFATASDSAALETRNQLSPEAVWLSVRRRADVEELQITEQADSQPETGQLFAEASEENLEARLKIAPTSEVLAMAAEIARKESAHHLWGAVAERLKHVEFDAFDAVVALQCMVKVGFFDRDLMTKVVDLIECRYFSMETGMRADLALQADDFQSLVRGLPVDHLVRLVLVDSVTRETGYMPRKPTPPEPEAKKKWRTIEPVDLEEWEREQFEKGRVKVLRSRMRHVEAKVTRMRPGNRLRGALMVDLMQALPEAKLETLAVIAQVCTFSRVRLLHGDLQDDFCEALSRRLLAFDTHEVVPYALAFASALRGFSGPEAYRAWTTKILPAVVQMPRRVPGVAILDEQRLFHPQLGGVPHHMGAVPTGGSTDAEAEVIRIRTDRAAQLFIAMATARQVSWTTGLFDATAGPLRTLLSQWLALQRRDLIMPCETLADLVDACVSCGVSDAPGDTALVELLARIFVMQFGDDILEERLHLSAYSISDLARVAHGATLLCDDVGELIDLVWKVAKPKLPSSEPHFKLMLLNAVVRGGSDGVLTSPDLIAAVDEHLVQKLDFDPASLGRLGV